MVEAYAVGGDDVEVVLEQGHGTCVSSAAGLPERLSLSV